LYCQTRDADGGGEEAENGRDGNPAAEATGHPDQSACDLVRGQWTIHCARPSSAMGTAPRRWHHGGTTYCE
jgi:hypothetical protein